MSSLPVAPKIDFVEATETSITVQFQPLENVGSGATSYVLQWKEYPDSWEGGASESATTTAAASSSLTKMEASPLKPGTTYCVRLVVRSKEGGGADGPPCSQLVVDTEQVGCTPQQKSCCALL